MLNDITLKNEEIITEAGARLHRLAWFACEQSIGDMEFCEDIPGTMGGALIMNAGQWEFTIGQYVNWIEVYNTETQTVEMIYPDEKFFAYRYSYIKQPRNYANAGSVFKRPVDKEGNSLYIWKMFDEVKLRGFRIGDAMVSEKHPGFIVNVGNANVEDVSALIKECKKRVLDQFDVSIELEWRVIS